MAEIARILGRQEEAERFAEQATLLRESFNKNFFDEKRGIYVDGIGTGHASLHANMFPLAFGLVPESHITSVVNYIKSRGMACSVYGAQYLLEALYNAGQDDYALALMTADTKRSWMNMIRAGSTVTTEAWDEYYKPNLTWNHAWGAAPANIIVRRLMGVRPLEPAFRLLEIKPQPGNLSELELKTPTIRGPVETNWLSEGKEFRLKVRIPANTKAHLWLPSVAGESFKEGGVKIKEQQNILPLGTKKGFTGFEVDGGEYEFTGNYTD